jgi:energy-coupling factor transporter ATP-binding protein EcfA2
MVREPHEVSGAERELRYPAGALVMVAGLPGAGKSTLLARLFPLAGDETRPVAVGNVRVIDSVQARNWSRRYLGGLPPPRLLIPLVYVMHVWRIARALFAGRSVVAHTRGTWAHLSYGLAWLARRLGTELHLVMLDVDPRTARAGQHARGRVLTATTFARHCRQWRRLLDRAIRTGELPPAASVVVLDRAAADQLKAIRFDG